MSNFHAQPVRIETNNGKYFGFEEALEKLERNSWIRKADDDDRIFSLTNIGYQEVANLKAFGEL